MTDVLAQPRGASLAQVSAALASGELTAGALARDVLDACAAENERLGAYVTIDREGALAAARASDERRAQGASRGPLDGVPVAVKDILVTEGLRTTACSRILGDVIPP